MSTGMGATPSTGAMTSPSEGTALGIAILAVWLGSTAAALLSPSLISGSEQEHLPLVSFTIWSWTLVTTGYLAMSRAAVSRADARRRTAFAASIVVVWVVMAAVCWLAPPFVTGTDPTSIPLASLLAPVLAMVVSGGLCISLANTSSGVAER